MCLLICDPVAEHLIVPLSYRDLAHVRDITILHSYGNAPALYLMMGSPAWLGRNVMPDDVSIVKTKRGTMELIAIIILGLIVVLGIAFFAAYNSLIRLRNQVDEGWAQIDVQLQRRHDLIPNLVNTVKGYAAHERETFEAVTAARAAALSASSPQELSQAEGVLDAAIGRLLAVAENYPQLQASTNFLQLQEELTTTENKVSFARQFYNSRVRELNTKIQTVPLNIVAGVAKITEREYFNVPEGSDVRFVPKVEF